MTDTKSPHTSSLDAEQVGYKQTLGRRHVQMIAIGVHAHDVPACLHRAQARKLRELVGVVTCLGVLIIGLPHHELSALSHTLGQRGRKQDVKAQQRRDGDGLGLGCGLESRQRHGWLAIGGEPMCSPVLGQWVQQCRQSWKCL